ncbi:MAG: CPXCG motif-containing cysteine-rich protein [Ghiorsea sp.]|nr:CPXCG motif-containing cysteine-rich protein [Ghiorsea sp.]
MAGTQTTTIQCPYCWEKVEILIDCSVAKQQYIEDCSVCCRPIVLTATCSNCEIEYVEAKSENE